MNNGRRIALRRHLAVSRRLLEYAAIERCRRTASVRFPFDGFLSDSHMGSEVLTTPEEARRIPIAEIASSAKGARTRVHLLI
jgi:hypothetical protein